MNDFVEHLHSMCETDIPMTQTLAQVGFAAPAMPDIASDDDLPHRDLVYAALDLFALTQTREGTKSLSEWKQQWEDAKVRLNDAIWNTQNYGYKEIEDEEDLG